MQHYFVSKNQFFKDHAIITGSDVHHIRHVMRMQLNDHVGILDNEGNGFEGILSEWNDDHIIVKAVQSLEASKTTGKITIAQALIKRDRFEWMLEKATELGAYAIIPTVFEHSIIKVDEERQDKKILRYQTIVKEASEQSRRLTIPKIGAVTPLKQLSYESYDVVLVCYEKANTSLRLKQLSEHWLSSINLLVIVGPEGGFSRQEIDFLSTKNVIFCSLGNRIVRSETASMLVLSYLNER